MSLAFSMFPSVSAHSINLRPANPKLTLTVSATLRGSGKSFSLHSISTILFTAPPPDDDVVMGISPLVMMQFAQVGVLSTPPVLFPLVFPAPSESIYISLSNCFLSLTICSSSIISGIEFTKAALFSLPTAVELKVCINLPGSGLAHTEAASISPTVLPTSVPPHRWTKNGRQFRGFTRADAKLAARTILP